MFIIIDGIDGSGKGTITDYFVDLLRESGKKVADLRSLMRETGRYPEAADWRAADAVVTTEPTYARVGLAIREELLRDPAYTPETVAEAFAVDREIHYRRVVIPARAAGKIVISERGISSSLAYQVVAGVPEAAVLALPGNRLALENAPDCLALAALDAATAVARLAARAGKADDSYFEKQPFLDLMEARYASAEFRRLFESRGARILEIPTAGSLEDTRRRVQEAYASIFPA